MAIYRFRLAEDNRPANGTLTLEGISGSGEFFVETGWVPQGGVVAFGNAFNLPPEFVPTSGAVLCELQQTGTDNIYDSYTHWATPIPFPIAADDYSSVLNPTTKKFVNPRAWYLFSSVSGAAADQVVFLSQEYNAETMLYAIIDENAEVQGNIAYFGVGSDVSAAYGLPALTRWKLVTTLNAGDDIAEMVFLDGFQVTGDHYNWGEDYRTGLKGRVTVIGQPVSTIGGALTVLGTDGTKPLRASVTVVPRMKNYQMFRMTDGTVEIEFATAPSVTTTLKFVVMKRHPQPSLQLREYDPCGDLGSSHGFWVRYKNLTKGNALMNYHIF